MRSLQERPGPVDYLRGVQWADDGELCKLLVQCFWIKVFVSRYVCAYHASRAWTPKSILTMVY